MRHIGLIVFLGLTLLQGMSVSQMKQESRYALIIANDLQYATEDVSAVQMGMRMGEFFTKKGFKVTEAFNLDRTAMIKSFRAFEKKMPDNGVLSVIYCGRTLTYDGEVWLLPAAMELESLKQLRLSALNLNQLLSQLQGHAPRVTLTLIDGYQYGNHQNDTNGLSIVNALKLMTKMDTIAHWSTKNKVSGFLPAVMMSIDNHEEDMTALTERLRGIGGLAYVAVSDFYFNVPDKISSPVDKAWQRAFEKQSVVGYEAFLIAYPESKYKQKAIDGIERLNAKKAANVSLVTSAEVSRTQAELKAAEAKLQAQKQELTRLKALQADQSKQAALAEETTETVVPEEITPLFYEPEVMVTLSENVFLMGSDRFDNTMPVHVVKVTQPIKISAYEVTNKEYAAFLNATGKKYRKKKYLNNETAAVVYVSWNDAQAYASWLSEMSGKLYRLPTEAEWEYAARGGSDTLYSWGDNPTLAAQYAWMKNNAHGFIHSGGLLQPNAFGLFDMAGNAAEWCLDAISSDYKNAPSSAEKYVEDELAMKVIRGGSYKDGREQLSPTFRNSNIPTVRSADVGFRLVEQLQ